jgi:hypothetical protein
VQPLPDNLIRSSIIFVYRAAVANLRMRGSPRFSRVKQDFN